MSIQSEPNQTSAAPIAPSMGQRAFGGAVWALAQTLGSKTAGITAQLILAALLSKDDFGRLAEVVLIISLAGLGAQLGIGEILVRRHRNFQKWADIAFWINLTAGCVGALVVTGISPFADYIFRDAHGLMNLLLVAAIALPFDAMTVISQARLRIDLRFRALAILGASNIIGASLLSVLFALIGHYWPGSPVGGAMALVLPRPLISAGLMLTSFQLSGFRPRMRPCFRRWGYVLRDSRYFFFSTIFMTLLTQGDYLLTGLFFSTERLGAYYFAFNLSTQTAQLVSNNLTTVLLPSFAKLDREPARQHAAYLRVCSAIALIGVTLCIVQGFMAAPLLHLMFGNKWDEAIPLFQILTVGMIFVMPSSPGVPLMVAQGKFRRVMIWTIVTALTFIGSVTVGALTGSTLGIAVADMLFFAVFGPLGVLVPLQMTYRAFAEVVRRVYGFPLGAGLLALGVGLAVGASLNMSPILLRALAASAGVLLTYAIAAWFWRRQELRQFSGLLAPYLTRFTRHAEGLTSK